MSRGLKFAAISAGTVCAVGIITLVAIGLAYIFDTEVSLWLWHGAWWLLIVANHLRIFILKRLCDRRARLRSLRRTMHRSMIPVLAVIYHESGRPSVASGDTLAHTLGQARPFTEYPDLRPEARLGRNLTAHGLLERFSFQSSTAKDRHDPADLPIVDVETLARGIHEAERPAIDRGWTVIVLDPPRPWIAFDDLPEQAKTGRRNQARYLLDRFVIVSINNA